MKYREILNEGFFSEFQIVAGDYFGDKFVKDMMKISRKESDLVKIILATAKKHKIEKDNQKLKALLKMAGMVKGNI